MIHVMAAAGLRYVGGATGGGARLNTEVNGTMKEQLPRRSHQPSQKKPLGKVREERAPQVDLLDNSVIGYWEFTYFGGAPTVYKVDERADYKNVGAIHTNMGGGSGGYFFKVWGWPMVPDDTDGGRYKKSRDQSLAFTFNFE